MSARTTLHTSRYNLDRWRPVFVDDLIRVGRDNDGGYVVSRRSIAGASAIVGLGVNDDWSFEREFQRLNPDAMVIAVDGSVSASVFRRHALAAGARALATTVRLRMREGVRTWRRAIRWWRTARDFRSFFEGREDRHFHKKFFSSSEGSGLITWAALKETLASRRAGGSSSHIFVKMDIEGAEYRTLPSILADAESITGLVVEFHDCDLLWERFAELMDQLSQEFAVVHMHGNNCVPLIPGTGCPAALEVSFARRSLLPGRLQPSASNYPLAGLDMPNLAGQPDYPLAFNDV